MYDLQFSAGCVEFARKQASELGLIFNVYEFVKNRPIVILTWPGLDANLPSILLIGHMDVVTVDEVRKRYTQRI